MVSVALMPRFGLEHLVAPGRYGAPDGDAGVEVALRTDLALATVIACKDQGHALAPPDG